MQLGIHIPEGHLVPAREELKEAMDHVGATNCLPLARFCSTCKNITSGDSSGCLNRSYNASNMNCWEELLLSTCDTLTNDINVHSFYDNYQSNSCHVQDIRNLLSSILEIFKQQVKSVEVVTGDIRNDLFTEVDNLTAFNVEASLVEGKNVICAEHGNTSFTHNTLSTSSGHETTSSSREFTSLHTISSSNTYSDYETISSSGGFTSLKTISISAEEGRGTEAEDSTRSLRNRSAESTLNSTRRKPIFYSGPSGTRSYLDQSPSKINEPVDSETGSSSCFKLFGRVMSASQYQVPTMNECRGESSVSDAPRSEGSAVVARTIPPWTMVDVEMITVNENDEEEL